MARGKLIIETLFEYNPETIVNDTIAKGWEIGIIKNHLDKDVLGRKLIDHSLEEFFMLVRRDCKLKTTEQDVIKPSKGEVFINLQLDPDNDN